MRKRKGNIEIRSEAELQAVKAAGQTHTDWDAAARLPVPDGSDPDDAMEPVEWGHHGIIPAKRKEESPP
jgi:hypothetical protein